MLAGYSFHKILLEHLLYTIPIPKNFTVEKDASEALGAVPTPLEV